MEHRTTAPTQIPVSVNEARAHLRIDLPDDDVEIYNLIARATEALEDYTGRACCDQVWTAYFDALPDIIKIYKRPIVSIDSLKYIDNDGNQQTYSSANYRTDLINGRITRAYGTSWPTIRDVTNAVEVAYTAGYGTTQSPVGVVPEDIKHAVLLMVSDFYEHKENIITGARVAEMLGPSSLKSLMDLNRVYAI